MPDEPQPSAILPREVVLTFEHVVGSWPSLGAAETIDSALLARVAAIVRTLARLTPRAELPRLQKAIAGGDGRAYAALIQLNEILGKVCGPLMQRCGQLKQQQAWSTLRILARLAADVAEATARDHDLATALFLLGRACRHESDTLGAIAAYRRTLQVAIPLGDRKLAAVVNDDLGLALSDVGQLDEALDCFRDAVEYEDDAAGRAAIEYNQALAERELGELRSASRTLRKRVKTLERAGAADQELALTLCDTAGALRELGEHAAALSMLDQAQAVLAPANLAGRAMHALARAQIYAAMTDKAAAGRAFEEAFGLARQCAHSQIDPEHYRRAFQAARPTRLPVKEALRLLMPGVAANDANAWGQAVAQLRQAANHARELGDEALALRIGANEVAALLNARQVKLAQERAQQIAHEAGERGFALPESMVMCSLGSLAAMGVELQAPLGLLGLYSRAVALFELHSQIIAASGLPADEARFETPDTGAPDNQLAKLAESYHADNLAARLFSQAIQKIRPAGISFQLVNRLAGLHAVLARQGDLDRANAVANELAALLAGGQLDERARLVAHRELAWHLTETDRANALLQLEQACALAEGLRQRIPPGPGRAEVNRDYPWLFHRLAELRRLNGQPVAAFEALQGDKSRRMIDVLAARAATGGPVNDAPPALAEASALLRSLGSETPTLLVDLAVERNGLTAYLVQDGTVQAVHVAGDVSGLAAAEAGDVREREAHVVKVCLNEPLLAHLAEAISAAAPRQSRLLLAPDGVFHNLPLHTVPCGGGVWCDRFPIGYIPAVGVLRFSPAVQRAAARSLVAGDSAYNLPFAADECKKAAAALGTEPLLGEHCTRAAIENRLRASPLDVIHLATHGRGDVRRGGRGSLLLADGAGGTEWVPIEELAKIGWQANLVVFSGCSTGVAGLLSGHELVSAARTALEAGARSVIACLWPVGDQAANVLMSAFYAALTEARKTGPVDLRVALDHARSGLRTWLGGQSAGMAVRRRDGRRESAETGTSPEYLASAPDMARVLSWGPFILLGSPLLSG